MYKLYFIAHVQVLMIQFYHFPSQTDLSKYNNVTVFLAPGVVSTHKCPFWIYTQLIKKTEWIKNIKSSTKSYITCSRHTAAGTNKRPSQFLNFPLDFLNLLGLGLRKMLIFVLFFKGLLKCPPNYK